MERAVAGKEARTRWGGAEEMDGLTGWMNRQREADTKKGRKRQNDKATTKHRKGEKERLRGNIFQSEADYSLCRHYSYRLPMALMWLAWYSKGSQWIFPEGPAEWSRAYFRPARGERFAFQFGELFSGRRVAIQGERCTAPPHKGSTQ